MKTNVKVKQPEIFTHEGAPASRAPTNEDALRRAIMSCLLWEDGFYESGKTIAARIAELVPLCKPEKVAHFAVKARTDMKLRHAPLLVVREMARATPAHRRLVAGTLDQVILRADELAEFMALYWKDGKQPISAQVKKGLARAFRKFNEYALGKYNRDGTVKLRDVLFLTHSKPLDAPARLYTKTERAAKKRVTLSPGEKLYRDVVADTLKTPDTWETELSAGADKAATFTRLISEDKLGALALLRNLRGMTEAGVAEAVIKGAIEKIDTKWVLPHRFIAAARYAPQFEHVLEPVMLKCAQELPKLRGKTVVLVDVSHSMDARLSSKSDMTRLDAACGVAMIAREVCDDVEIFSFSSKLTQVPARRGFALRDAITASQPHMDTFLGAAVQSINTLISYNRLIVVTDEQSQDRVGGPHLGTGYTINVASNRNGVGYGPWIKVDGFSEAVVRYIAEFESQDN